MLGGKEPLAFFFSFRRGSNVDEGGRNAEIGTEPRFGSGKGTSKRKSRGSSRCKDEDKEEEKSRQVCQKGKKKGQVRSAMIRSSIYQRLVNYRSLVVAVRGEDANVDRRGAPGRPDIHGDRL